MVGGPLTCTRGKRQGVSGSFTPPTRRGLPSCKLHWPRKLLLFSCVFIWCVLFVLHVCWWFSSKLKWGQLELKLRCQSFQSWKPESPAAKIKVMSIQPPQASIQNLQLEVVPPQGHCNERCPQKFNSPVRIPRRPPNFCSWNRSLQSLIPPRSLNYF